MCCMCCRSLYLPCCGAGHLNTLAAACAAIGAATADAFAAQTICCGLCIVFRSTKLKAIVLFKLIVSIASPASVVHASMPVWSMQACLLIPNTPLTPSRSRVLLVPLKNLQQQQQQQPTTWQCSTTSDAMLPADSALLHGRLDVRQPGRHCTAPAMMLHQWL
jgi:hypothetical protein